jgi:hypothetical protein
MQYVEITVLKCKSPLEAEAYKKRIEKREEQMKKRAAEEDYFGPVGSNLIAIKTSGSLLLQYHDAEFDADTVLMLHHRSNQEDPEQFLRGEGRRQAREGFDPQLIPTVSTF